MKPRYIPSNSTLRVLELPEVKAVIYVYENKGEPCAIGYSGRRTKPDFNFRYASVERREKHFAQYQATLKDRMKEVETRRSKRATFKHSLSVGDILYSSWGYEQTNIDFYQVTEVVSDKTIKIREIGSKDVGTGTDNFMSGRKVAVKDDFLPNSKEMTKRVQCCNDQPYIRLNSYSWTTPWDGRPMSYSWYA